MRKQLRILLTGLLVVVPFAITVWAIWTAGLWLDKLGIGLALKPVWDLLGLHEKWNLADTHGLGALVVVLTIYLVGVLMHFWLFRRIVELAEKLIERVPGVKTLYESVRDLMKLFGPETRKTMGRVVEYRPAGSEIGVLGILTNERPAGTADAGKAAVYFPLAYMIGGPVLFVPRERLREVDMPVERALRLCATAHVTAEQSDPDSAKGTPGETEPQAHREQ